MELFLGPYTISRYIGKLLFLTDLKVYTIHSQKCRKVLRKLFLCLLLRIHHICKEETNCEQNCWCEPSFKAANCVDFVAYYFNWWIGKPSVVALGFDARRDLAILQPARFGPTVGKPKWRNQRSRVRFPP